MAERTLAFSGAMAARALAEENKKKQEGPAPTTARSSRPASGETRVRTLHEMMVIDPTLVEYEKG